MGLLSHCTHVGITANLTASIWRMAASAGIFFTTSGENCDQEGG